MAITEMPTDWIFRINLPKPDDLEEVHKSWDIEVHSGIAYVGQNYRFLEPLAVRVRGNWTRPAFFVKIEINSLVEVPCRRCLDPATVAINGKFSYLYSLSPEEKHSDGHGDDGYVRIKSWGSCLDIAPQVWDTLILSLPTDVLCRDDCRGLCPVCGINLNRESCDCSRNGADPRLDILRHIKNDTVK